MVERYRDQPVVIVERSSTGLSPFFWGIAVGAGLALLFAPQSGEETRREIRARGRRLRTAAGEKAEEVQGLVETGFERTKAWVEEGLDTARRTIDDKRDDAREALDAGRAAVHSARDELETRLSKARTSRGKAGPEKEAAGDDGDA